MTASSDSRLPIRIMVIGAGPAAVQMHLPELGRLRDRGEIVLAKVCDIHRERAHAARTKFGFLEGAGDGAAALESKDDIDAVYIFGSAQLHYEYGLEALRCGKHLFVEKPVAPSYLQAMELARTARARGLVAVGGHNRRFYHSLAAVRERAGAAGWRFAEAVFHKPEFGTAPPFGAPTWLTANGIHALDALLFMMGGVPEQLTAMSGEPSAAQPDMFSCVMRWSNGSVGSFLCNNSAGVRREEYVFHGPGLTCTVSERGVAVATASGTQEISSPMIGDGIAAEHEAFFRAIRTGETALHSIESIAPSLLVAELIEKGHAGRVRLPQVESAMAPKSARKSLLVTNPERMPEALAQLLPRYEIVSVDEVRRVAGQRPDVVAAILGQSSEPLDAATLAKLPSLAVVGIVGLSIARYEPQSLLARGITLVNASSAYAESVAEFALGLAILARRRAFDSHEDMRRGGWGGDRSGTRLARLIKQTARQMRPAIKAVGLESRSLGAWRKAHRYIEKPGDRPAMRQELRGATAGLIGWGANARAFAQRLVRADVRVFVYSEHAPGEEIRGAGASPASLGEVLAADIVSLHRGLTSQTRHAIGAAELDRLRPGAVLINAARGALIEPKALLVRLKRGDVFACLDTFDHEPLSRSHELRRLPNVFLTAHIAGGSAKMLSDAADEVVRKVVAHLQGAAVDHLPAERLLTMT